MDLIDQDPFDRQFAELTGVTPMPWQSRLYREWFRQGRLPSAIDLPTGLGKTSVIALWLLAIRAGARLPRRLVYVVDRRAVVDQATEFVETLCARLPTGEVLPLLSTLRGQHADNRQWLDDPAAPAIIIGTVDMIGSRLLFEGYGVSRRMRPYQAGLLGVDALVVLDEAHLVPPFERLLADVERSGAILGARFEEERKLLPPLRLVSLSATGREREGETFGLNADDLGTGESLTRQRVTAAKTLTVRQAEPGDLSVTLANVAWDLTEKGNFPLRCLVYCNSREEAEKTHAELQHLVKDGPIVELFTGARRGYERDRAARRLREFGFLAGAAEQPDQPRFLVATSAGEVGIDLDADHMVCDLVAWERMVQRLGRVNRRGEKAARIVVVDVAPRVPKGTSDQERQRIEAVHQSLKTLLALLPGSNDGSDASPQALRALSQSTDPAVRENLTNATSPIPLRPALSRPLLDAWSMTSLVEHTGRPEVAPWLRGWIDEEPQTVVAWRAHLPVPSRDVIPESGKARDEWLRAATAYFEAAPPHVSEQLSTESWRVAEWLTARAKSYTEAAPAPKNGEGETPPRLKPREVVAMLLSGAGEVVGSFTLARLVEIKKERLPRELAGKTLVVDRRLGGLAETGSLDENADQPPRWVGDDDAGWTADERDSPQRAITWRVVRVDGESASDLGAEWRPRFEFVLDRNGEGEVTSCLAVFRFRQAVTNEEERAVGGAQSLHDHQCQVTVRARALAERLGLPSHYQHLLAIAARLHDEGKASERWQRAFRAPPTGRPYAKAPGPVNTRLLDGYRHEFGSLFRAEQDPEVMALDADSRDLVLHLIAAHHGNARPTIATAGCEQAPPSLLESRARDVALRFARLQRRWGPWGLAWWESLLRAADQQASKDNEKGGS